MSIYDQIVLKEFELQIIDHFHDNLFPNVITFLVKLEKITARKSPVEALNRYEKQKEERLSHF